MLAMLSGTLFLALSNFHGQKAKGQRQKTWRMVNELGKLLEWFRFAMDFMSS